MNITYRPYCRSDLKEMKSLLLDQGQNQWNYLPQNHVNETFLKLAKDQATASLSLDGNRIIGFSLSLIGEASPDHLTKYVDLKEILFIAEVVVHSAYSGKGIGSTLLKSSIDAARSLKLKQVFTERHEENPGSAGMMKNAGFDIVETYFDPEKRTSGSRNSSILRYPL